MAALGAISAKFTTRDFSRSAIVGKGLELEKVNMVNSGPPMCPFEMVAYGSGHDGSSQFTALVIAHESNELALINSRILVQRIREAVTSNR